MTCYAFDLMKLRIVPTDLKTANEFVRKLHRHSRPVVGHRFAVGVADEDAQHGWKKLPNAETTGG